MNFEQPQQEPTPDFNEKSEPSKLDKAKRFLKKSATLAGLGATLLSTEGCADEGKEKAPPKGSPPIVQKTEGRKPRSGFFAEHEREDKVRRENIKAAMENITQILSGNFDLSTNSFLGYYKERVGQQVPPEFEPVMQEGKKMRKLEIAEKHGFDIHKPLSRNIPGGVEQRRRFEDVSVSIHGIPLVFEIDGRRFEVERKDLTERELEVLRSNYSFFQSDPVTLPDDPEEMKRNNAKIIRDHQEVRKIFERLGITANKTETRKTEPAKPAQKQSGGNLRQSKEVPIVDGDEDINQKGTVRVGPDFDRDGNF